MTLTFKIICEPKEAERLGWLSNDLDMKLNKAIAERLALTGRFNVALTTISWKAEEEFEDEKKDPRPDWFGESWCD